jgi:hypothetical protein
MPTVLTYRFVMHFSFYLLTSEKCYQQARYGEENPKQQIEKPAEQEPVKHSVMLVLYDRNRLDVHVPATTFGTSHFSYSLYAGICAYFGILYHSIRRKRYNNIL